MRWRIRMSPVLLCVVGICISVALCLVLVAISHGHNVDEEEKELTKDSEFHYVIVIDAGSSGSRLYMYRCDYDRESINGILRINSVLNEVGQPVVKKKSPGLSSFASNPEAAVQYIKSMIDSSTHYLPKESFRQTSLFVLATAGMRLLASKEQNGIMAALRQRLPKMYDFVIGENSIQVISGKWEGIYAWISVNYLLRRFQDAVPSSLASSEADPLPRSTEMVRLRKPTAGIIDLGGASLQLAYEVKQRPVHSGVNNTLIQELNLGPNDSSPLFKYSVFVNTYLGYGANTAIDRYEQWLAKSAMEFEANRNQSVVEVGDCCLPTGLKKRVKIETVELVRNGQGCYDTCYESARKLILANVSCSAGQCALEGVSLPEIHFPSTDFYGMSEYWYCTNDVLNRGGIYNYELVRKSSMDFCHLNWTSIWAKFRQKKYPSADKERIRTQCFKAAWAFALLHEGLKFPTNVSKFYSVAKMGGHDMQWTLGAALYRLRHLPLRLLNEFSRPTPEVHSRIWFRSSVFGWHSWFLQIMFFLGSVVLLLFVVDFFLLHCCRQNRGVYFFSGLRKNRSFINYMMIDNGDLSLPLFSKPSSR